MSGRLTWGDAASHDRAGLTEFCCTEKPTKSHATNWRLRHPRMWEYEAQEWIRDLEAPRPPKFLRLGKDEEGIGTVAYYEEVRGPRYVEVLVAAVAHRLQRRGYGSKMCEDLLNVVSARAVQAGLNDVIITGRIYKANERSQAMCTSAGADWTGETYSTGAQVWALRLRI